MYSLASGLFSAGSSATSETSDGSSLALCQDQFTTESRLANAGVAPVPGITATLNGSAGKGAEKLKQCATCSESLSMFRRSTNCSRCARPGCSRCLVSAAVVDVAGVEPGKQKVCEYCQNMLAAWSTLKEGQAFQRRDIASKTPIFLQIHATSGGPVILSFRNLNNKDEPLSAANSAPFGAVAAIRGGRDKLSIVLTSAKGKDMVVDATPKKGRGSKPRNAVQVRDEWLRLLVQTRSELQVRLQPGHAQALPQGNPATQQAEDQFAPPKPESQPQVEESKGSEAAPEQSKPSLIEPGPAKPPVPKSTGSMRSNPFAISNAQTNPTSDYNNVPSAFLGVVQSSSSSIPGSEKYSSDGFPL